MKQISEISAFCDEIQTVYLPASRIIGREVRNGGKLGNTAPALWDSIYTSDLHQKLEALPQVVSKDLFGWTMEYDPESATFIYMVCALTPPGTEVPAGFTYRDIPATECAVGLYGESVGKTLKRAAELGYTDNWSSEGCGWNAELYFHAEEEAPPKKCDITWHHLVPIKRSV